MEDGKRKKTRQFQEESKPAVLQMELVSIPEARAVVALLEHPSGSGVPWLGWALLSPGSWGLDVSLGLRTRNRTAQGTIIPCFQWIHTSFPLRHARHFPWDNERVTEDPEKRLWDKSCSFPWAGDDEEPWGWEWDGADDSRHPAADIPGPFSEPRFSSIPRSYSSLSFLLLTGFACPLRENKLFPESAVFPENGNS